MGIIKNLLFLNENYLFLYLCKIKYYGYFAIKYLFYRYCGWFFFLIFTVFFCLIKISIFHSYIYPWKFSLPFSIKSLPPKSY